MLLSQMQVTTQQQIDAQREQIKGMIETQKLEIESNNKKFSDLQKRITTLPTGSTAVSTEFSIESLANSMEEFSYDPNNTQTVSFDSWYARYEGLFKEDAKNLDDAAKVRLLVRKLNNLAFERFGAIILPKEPKDLKFEDAVKTLKSIFGRTESLFNRRVKCLQLTKHDMDDFVAYAGQVNRACEEFKLGELTVDEFKCLIFVHGLTSPTDEPIRTRLLSKLDTEEGKKLKVENLANEAIRVLNLRSDSAMLEGQSNAPQANVVKQNFNRSSNFNRKDKDVPSYPCWKCGQLHYVKSCPFSNHRCDQCGKTGHKEGFCSKNNPAKQNTKRKFKPRSHKRTFDNSCHSKGVYAVQNSSSWEERRKYFDVQINDTTVRLQYDSAADFTIISPEVYEALGRPVGRATAQRTKSASRDVIPLEYELQVTVTFLGQTKHCRCFVSTIPDLNLFGIEWIELWNLWDIPISSISKVCSQYNESILAKQLSAKYPTVFTDTLGLCNKTRVKLFLKPGSRPIFRPKRPVPSSSFQIVDDELKRLEDKGILSQVDHSNWAAPIVVVKKANGSVRICADFSTGLNEALEPNQYPLPLPDEIFAKLAGCHTFSIIDLSDAYLQVEVDDDSRELLTINTHRGLFRYNRLVPGVKSAPGAFQRIIDSMIAGISGVSSYLDDLIVYGKNENEHLESLTKLLDKICEYGFHLRMDKCRIGMSQIKYLGHIVDANGLRPDPAKIGAILNMPAPTDISSLRSFLGAINFYGKFVPTMHELRRPLDQLLRKDVKWKWSNECQQAFEKFKSTLQSDLLLTHFDPRLEIIVAADASNYGIGACLLHRFPNGSIKAVLHVARSLTQTEQNYSQVEKEGLALVFAVKKFHRFIYGRKFLMQTDHKPLLTIFGSKKGIPIHTANRLQRWALTLLGYDFKVEYISTTQFGHADVLSRLINRHAKPDEECVIATVRLEEDLGRMIDDTMYNLPVKFDDVLAATNQDQLLQTVIKYVQTNWPSNIKTIFTNLQPFYRRREGLNVIRGCLFFGERIVIPSVLRFKVLKELHFGHPGIVRMKSIARSYVFWPAIDEDVQKYVQRCSSCAKAAKLPVKHTLASWPTPSGPWERIHIDFAGPIDGLYFLLVVDALTKWPEIFATRSMTAQVTVKFLQTCFSRFGYPATIVSDNGTQFTSHLFRRFCESGGIEHLTTAPFHPQSNGQAERFVDTFKRAIHKINKGEPLEETLTVFLTYYRSTPCPAAPNGMSPAEAMFGRRTKIILDLLKPPSRQLSLPDSRRLNQNRQFDVKHGAKQREFKPMDDVYVQIHRNNKWHWEPGHICEKQGKVNYVVMLDNRKHFVVRSHANQIRLRYSSESPSQVGIGLPLDILLDEFKIPHVTPSPAPELPQPMPTDQQPAPAPPAARPTRVPIANVPIEPVRRSTRTIVRPSRFADYVGT